MCRRFDILGAGLAFPVQSSEGLSAWSLAKYHLLNISGRSRPTSFAVFIGNVDDRLFQSNTSLSASCTSSERRGI